MFTDLFSSLDGAYNIWLWFPSLLGLLFISTHVPLGNVGAPLAALVSNIWSEKSILRYNPFKLLLTAVFIFLLLTNFLGLTPFTYSLSRDLFTISCVAGLLWSLLLLSGWVYAPIQRAAHLAPQGAPLALAPFLVLIETIRILIRPLTLTVRLIANIRAGHIVLGLLANSLTSLVGHILIVPILLLNVGYILFEFFVCVIQAYIFSLLISLYQTEHP